MFEVEGPITRKRVAMMVFVVAALMPNSILAQPQLVGNAIVVDGDTIEIRDVRVRFFGIDAPEKRQLCLTSKGKIYSCGKRSTAYLTSLVGGRQVRCEDIGQAKFGRRWGRCFVGEVNLQSAMVRAGHARAYPLHSDDYVREQSIAQQIRQGIWQGMHVPPGKFRKCKRKGRSARECSF